MTGNEFQIRTGRAAPSAAERQLAATIRVKADRERGARTPQWVSDLARRDNSSSSETRDRN